MNYNYSAYHFDTEGRNKIEDLVEMKNWYQVGVVFAVHNFALYVKSISNNSQRSALIIQSWSLLPDYQITECSACARLSNILIAIFFHLTKIKWISLIINSIVSVQQQINVIGLVSVSIGLWVETWVDTMHITIDRQHKGNFLIG